MPIPRSTAITPLLLTTLTGALAAQTFTVVPAAYAGADAISYEWLAGASRDLRQQTLIGQSHLQPLLGRTITAFEFRRTAADEVYQPGTANWTVRMSISPHSPLTASSNYADNPGPSPVLVYQGPVSLPLSPPAADPNVAWSASNVVRVVLQTPFVYQGGTLCVDVIGAPIAGQNANWWMADAEFEDLAGTAVDLGNGCGIYGGPQHRWANVATRSLLPGAYARFFAYGTPGGLALAAFGQPNPIGVPLSALGFPSGAGCDLHLSTVDTILVEIFEPQAAPFPVPAGGIAEVRLKLPIDPVILGFTMTTQWLDWSQMATSQAIVWSVAGAVPTLDMALLEGHPQELGGELSVHLAPVIRFEHQ
jgi:hypothetical protein